MSFSKLIPTLCLILYFGCSCKGGIEEITPILEVAEQDQNISFLAEQSSRTISISTTTENFSAQSNVPWCLTEVNIPNKKIQILVQENSELDIRNAIVEIKAGSLSKSIKITQMGRKPEILIKKKNFSLDFRSQLFDIEVTTNVELELSNNTPWLKLQPTKKSARVELTYSFQSEQLPDKSNTRSGIIYFKQKGGILKDSVIVTQTITAANDYNPALTSCFEKDKKIKIQQASITPAEEYQSGEDILKSIDGQYSTIYHSRWSGMQANSSLTMEFIVDPSDAAIANYIVLHPRTSGMNGIIKSATVWISTAENSAYSKIGTISAPLSNNPVVVYFSHPVINPRKLKIEVTDTYSQDSKYYVSLAEVECYESRTLNSVTEDMKWFTDKTFSELVPGVGLNDIAEIKNPFIQNIATYLLINKYPKEYRVQQYKAYRDVSDLAKELKMSAYSQYENPTGICFQKDEEVVVFVGENKGEEISLRVCDFGSSGEDYFYPLREGVNILKMKGQGNGYVNYYSANYKSTPNVKIHIASGKVNGYFNISRHSNEEGSRLLDQASSEIMDIVGNRVQLAYSVSALRKYSYSRMKDLIQLYDSIISIEQTMLGLKKYNRLPPNHMFGRVVWDGYMFADGIGAGFNENTMSSIANPDEIARNNWGIAHEFGHVNQVRPGMKWVGTTECTNNIYSAWVQYVFTPNKLRLEHENIGGSIGGRFNAYLNNALIENQEWGIQGGPDKAYGANSESVWGGDHFVKLCPLWQLQLFFHLAGEGNSWHKPYFWADIFEKVRITDELMLSDGELQINFVKNACDATQCDLSDFFIRVGMLKKVDKVFDDYSTARKTITQQMIDETVAYAKKYERPATDYIFYISGNSVDSYKNKRKISGSYGVGISGDTQKQIDHGVWKNVTVFETYQGNTLTHITMVGTGSAGNAYTNVPYPANSTRIEAVAWDGTKVLVLGKR